MSEPEPQSTASSPNWSRRIVVALVLGGALFLIALAGAAFVPRWWAQRVGDQVSGSIASGTSLGLVYGFVFTLLPLVVLALGVWLIRSWTWRAVVLAVAVVLAAPNLMTLGIVLGTGSGAHAGDRILDVEAPGFRGATLAGALVAAGLVAVAWYLISSRRRALRRADDAVRAGNG
jgi:hypothetical protein